MLYQFTARGHDVTQALLAQHIDGPRDGLAVYYRSRPLMLGLGLELDEALASTMMRAGGMSEGRDIGVVFNLPRLDGPCVLPACGGVGTQFSPAVGWAQSLLYRSRVLGEKAAVGCIAVAHGGEASTATSGFWAALNIATTQRLPVLFFIEDNGYGISVRSDLQTPGANIAANLASFGNLRVLDGDGTDPGDCAGADRAGRRTRAWRLGPGAAATHRSAPFRALWSGHAGVQDRAGAGGRSGARPAGAAAEIPRAGSARQRPSGRPSRNARAAMSNPPARRSMHARSRTRVGYGSTFSANAVTTGRSTSSSRAASWRTVSRARPDPPSRAPTARE